MQMGFPATTERVLEDLKLHVSELRLEPPSSVGFSDPCPHCGNRKRRRLHPPTRERKKVLVIDFPDEDEETAVPSPSTPEVKAAGVPAQRLCACEGDGGTPVGPETPSPLVGQSGVTDRGGEEGEGLFGSPESAGRETKTPVEEKKEVVHSALKREGLKKVIVSINCKCGTHHEITF